MASICFSTIRTSTSTAATTPSRPSPTKSARRISSSAPWSPRFGSTLPLEVFIPLALGGFYTRKQIDVGVVFSDDLKQGTDYLRLDLLLRYAIK